MAGAWSSPPRHRHVQALTPCPGASLGSSPPIPHLGATPPLLCFPGTSSSRSCVGAPWPFAVIITVRTRLPEPRQDVQEMRRRRLRPDPEGVQLDRQESSPTRSSSSTPSAAKAAVRPRERQGRRLLHLLPRARSLRQKTRGEHGILLQPSSFSFSSCAPPVVVAGHHVHHGCACARALLDLLLLFLHSRALTQHPRPHHILLQPHVRVTRRSFLAIAGLVRSPVVVLHLQV